MSLQQCALLSVQSRLVYKWVNRNELIYFLPPSIQLVAFESGHITPRVAYTTISQMKNVSYATSPIYGGDVLMTFRYSKVILTHEIDAPALNMVSQRYRDFVQVGGLAGLAGQTSFCQSNKLYILCT